MKKSLAFLLASLMVAPLFAQQLIVPDNHATIQAAIDAAQAGDTVLVRRGFYAETIDFKGKAVIVASEFIYQKNYDHIDSTIITGDGSNFPVRFTSGEDTTSQLIGFTLKKGGADTSLYRSGFVLVQNASPRVGHNRLRDYFPPPGLNRYGGITCLHSEAILHQNEFYNVTHHSSEYGAFILAEGGAPRILSNSFFEGYIGFVDYSAAILLKNSDAHVIGNSIYNFNGGYVNIAGAGILIMDSDPVIHFNVVSNAWFDQRSGGILGIRSHLDVVNNTLFYNQHGIMLLEGGSATVKNTIVWNSLTAPFHNEDDLGTITVTYSDIEGGWPGTGNIDAFPRFANPLQYSFFLIGTSPCIEAGDPASPLKSNGRRMDMGARLFLGLPSSVPEQESAAFNIHPNPAQEYLQVTLPDESSSSENVAITLRDISGRVALVHKTDPKEQVVELDLSNLAPGIYLITLKAGDKESTQKVVKE